MTTRVSPDDILSTTGQYTHYPEFRQHLLTLKRNRQTEREADEAYHMQRLQELQVCLQQQMKPPITLKELDEQKEQRRKEIDARYQALETQAHQEYKVPRIDHVARLLTDETQTRAFYVDERRLQTPSRESSATLQKEEDGTWTLVLVRKVTGISPELIPITIELQDLSAHTWKAAGDTAETRR